MKRVSNVYFHIYRLNPVLEIEKEEEYQSTMAEVIVKSNSLRFKCFLFSFLVILLSYSVQTVNCDDLQEAQLINEDDASHRHENLNVMHLVGNRPSDVRIRSIVPSATTKSTSDAQLVRESILDNIAKAAEGLTSRKCRDDIQFALSGIRQKHHWALGSRSLRINAFK